MAFLSPNLLTNTTIVPVFFSRIVSGVAFFGPLPDKCTKMKLHHKNIEKDSHGFITMTPEEPEDMWHVYNLIAVGDTVRASTIRKVTTESTTGSTTSNRIRTILSIRVEDVDFDNQACKVNPLV